MLLELAPDLTDFQIGAEASMIGTPSLNLSVMGAVGCVRHISLTRLLEDESGELVPAPRAEIVIRADLKSAHVVSYEDALILREVYRGGSDEPHGRPNRLISRLIESFLSEVLAQGYRLRENHAGAETKAKASHAPIALGTGRSATACCEQHPTGTGMREV